MWAPFSGEDERPLEEGGGGGVLAGSRFRLGEAEHRQHLPLRVPQRAEELERTRERLGGLRVRPPQVEELPHAAQGPGLAPALPDGLEHRERLPVASLRLRVVSHGPRQLSKLDEHGGLADLVPGRVVEGE